MKFSIFKTVKANRGRLCTYEVFKQATTSELVGKVCKQIAAETDHDKQGELKKQLPVITWQAYFEGARKNQLAQPSGVVINDFDDVEDPEQLWRKIESRREELGILLAHKTPSCHGLRVVFRWKAGCKSIDECQQWMAKEIGVAHDPACKDWARASYVVPEGYVYYLDEKGLFEGEGGRMYDVGCEMYDVRGKREDVRGKKEDVRGKM